jgi:hypothetical protein
MANPSCFYVWRRRLSVGQQPCTGGFLELIFGKLADADSGISARSFPLKWREGSILSL